MRYRPYYPAAHETDTTLWTTWRLGSTPTLCQTVWDGPVPRFQLPQQAQPDLVWTWFMQWRTGSRRADNGVAGGQPPYAAAVWMPDATQPEYCNTGPCAVLIVDGSRGM